MLQMTANEITRAGGLLAALAVKSGEYVGSLIPNSKMLRTSRPIRRHIVHTDPHLDEYFAELMFRAWMPTGGPAEFIEESLFSKDNDFGAQQLWPEAAVFGIGRTVSSGVKPILLFDEHVAGKGKLSASCAELVVGQLEKASGVFAPGSVQRLLQEINAVDEFGGAHPQHLGNIVKTLHSVRFLFAKGKVAKDDVRDFLSPAWKRSLVSCCLVSIIYCLENHIDLIGDATIKKNALQSTLDHYVRYSLHRGHPKFEEARQTISSNYGNQRVVFEDAVLKGAQARPLTDKLGNKIPQLLLLSRVCFAAYACWGTEIANIVMMHLWEAEFQRQINFLTLYDELQSSIRNNVAVDKRTSVGVLRFMSCSVSRARSISGRMSSRPTINSRRESPIWLISISPATDVFSPHQAAMNFINTENEGCGLVLVENSYMGTKTLFKSKSIPDGKWALLANTLKSLEPDCWYDASTDPDRPAPFLNNGNKAHQYVPRSGLDIQALGQLVNTIFK